MATTEKTLWDYFYGKIKNAYGVAGLLANLYAESGLAANNLQNTFNKSLGMTDTEYTAAVDNGTYTKFVTDGAGYGLAQWTYSTRKQNLYSYIKAKSVSIADETAQAEFLYKELSEDFASVLKTLKNATSCLEASNAVLTGFECPADQSSSVQSKREGYAKTYYNKYAASSDNSSSGLVINQNSNFGTHNTSVRSGNIEYIVMHYVGATGGAEANVNYYNQASTTGASADFFVGFSGEIWQYNPDPKSRYCWAVGGGKQTSYGGSLYGTAKNANTIHIEMCVRNKGDQTANSSDWYFEDATITSAIALVKYLMSLYGIAASHVIRHYDVNGKLCPGVVGWNDASGSESAWNDFKTQIGDTSVSAAAETTSSGNYYKVRKTWADESSQKGAFTSLTNAKKCADLYSGYYVFDWNGNAIYPTTSDSSVPYKVKVEISDLNIRKGPGTSYAKTGKFTGKGTFTIVEEDSGWGLLKAYESTRDGWISLSYATKVS